MQPRFQEKILHTFLSEKKLFYGKRPRAEMEGRWWRKLENPVINHRRPKRGGEITVGAFFCSTMICFFSPALLKRNCSVCAACVIVIRFASSCPPPPSSLAASKASTWLFNCFFPFSFVFWVKPGGGQRPPSEKGEKGGLDFRSVGGAEKIFPWIIRQTKGYFHFFCPNEYSFLFFRESARGGYRVRWPLGGASKPPLSLLATCPAYVLRALCHRNREKISSVPLRNRHGLSGPYQLRH